jgi:hypothetical protein
MLPEEVRMACFRKKVAAAGAAAGMATSGATAVVGMTTVIVGVIGWVAFASMFALFITAALDLVECLREEGKEEAANKLAAKIEQMQAEMRDMQRRLGLAD